MITESRSSSQEESQIREVLEFAPMGAFLINIKGKCFFVNKEWESISGLSMDQSLEKGWLKAVIEEDILSVRTVLDSAVTEKKEKMIFFFRVKHPERGIRYCRAHVKRMETKESEKYFLGYVQDITEERNVTHILRKQNELFSTLKNVQDQFYLNRDPQKLFSGLLESIIDITESKSGYILQLTQGKDAEDQWAEILAVRGIPFLNEQAVMRMPLSRLINDPDISLKNVLKNRRACISNMPGRSVFLSRSGTLQLQSYVEMPAGIDEELVGVIGLANRKEGYDDDFVNFLEPLLTTFASLVIFNRVNREKKESEIRQKELTAHLQALITSLDDIVLEIDGDDKTFLEVWVRDEKILFMPRDQIVGKTIPEVFGEGAPLFLNPVEEVLRTGKELEFEYKHIDPSLDKWYRAKVSPVRSNSDDPALKLAILIRDITQERKNEEELVKAKNLAEEAANAKTNFLSVMSHEIRTPLNGIIGIANLMKQSGKEGFEENVNNLFFSANHLLQLVNDILDLNKIESEKLELVESEVSLKQLSENILNQFMLLADSKNIELKSKIDEQLPSRIMADPVRLSQILNNLVSNAVKFTDLGSVILSVELKEKTNRYITVYFSVKDSGLGIPENMREVIFESFKQAQQSAHRKHPGTGLGLTITKKLLELHQSKIHLKSEPGKGSEFYFDIRFEVPEVNSSVQRVDIASDINTYKSKLKGLKILLVEDNLINTIVARKQLEYFGLYPDSAADGKEALVMLEKNKYHLAIIDLHMPEMDGYELSAYVQKNYPNIHIVIFTADIMSGVRQKLAEMGIEDIVNKPFVPDEVLRVLLKASERLHG